MLTPDPHQRALQNFASLVEPAREDQAIELGRAALGIAHMEYPNLDSAHYIARLEQLAARASAELRPNPTARESIAVLNRVLFDDEGLRGNRDDYYDPRNSFLNDVLDRKIGIPISLSVVYMEVAWRIGFPVCGTCMPGHFLLKHYDPFSGEIILDPFNGGRVLTMEGCGERLKEIYRGELEMRPEFLQPVTRREILIRMLNNLRQIYFTKRDLRKGLATLDLLLAIPPRCADLLRERALVRLNLDQFVGAARDLAQYLKLAPEAADAEDVKETLDMVRQLISRLN